MSGFDQALRQAIATGGPISLADYMAGANAHYYATRDPLGAAGDFVTAPEVSQMFGELIGLWLADLWQRAGQPGVALVELGPGRGTLMADIRRSVARLPALAATAPDFVETSPVLRARQAAIHPDGRWHDDLASLPGDRPLLIVANEFFDALPVVQHIRTGEGWRERKVGLDGDALVMTVGDAADDRAIPPALAGAPNGAIVEQSPAGLEIMRALAGRLVAQGGVLLVVDYGYSGPAAGDTLQAVRGHRFADPLAAPGESDLTAHVDFTALADAARSGGATCFGPASQGDFLGMLGIDARTAKLASANPESAASLMAQRQRLVAADQMGALFKALAVVAPDWPPPAGF
jgi:SAM-dependent MidA family methyltransferase